MGRGPTSRIWLLFSGRCRPALCRSNFEKGDAMITLSFLRTAMGLALSLAALSASAADYPAPQEGDWVARDFSFHTGEVMPELRLHYTTIGAGEPVLVLHGTAGSGSGMLTPTFAGELFGPGQPLDASRYFIILPDAIG